MKTHGTIKAILIAAFLVLAVLGLCFWYATLPADVRRKSVHTVNGYDVRDYDRDELEEILNEELAWNLRIVVMTGTYDGLENEEYNLTSEVIENDSQVSDNQVSDEELLKNKNILAVISLEDAISDKISETLDEAYSSKRGFKKEISLSKKEIKSVVDEAFSRVSNYSTITETEDGIIVYNEATDSFDFNDTGVVCNLDYDALEDDIRAALKDGDYDATIVSKYDKQEISLIDGKYELLATFTTETTANANRNNNLEIACETINGTIVESGAQFSYNETLGKRTAEKGYKLAGAYNNGQHVQAYGGGICQLSTTMYNACFAANLTIDERTAHSYEPSYVTPGQDATVSYSTLDYKFTNSLDYPIGILTHYKDQTVTVEIYGVSSLDDGVTRYMDSEKVSNKKWDTYEVLEKDGEVISREYLYTTKYR